MAEIGTPIGLCHSGAIIGHCSAGVQKREFACDESSPLSGVQLRPFQSVKCAGWVSLIPSHHTSPSSVRPTFVNIEFPFSIVRMALEFVVQPVPGATPKKPYSGLLAYRRPSSPKRIHAISSPRVSTFHPLIVGSNIARFVLPHADGKAAAT